MMTDELYTSQAANAEDPRPVEPISDEDLEHLRIRCSLEIKGLIARLDLAEASLTSAERRATQANDQLMTDKWAPASREQVMKQWDMWRRYIAEGGGGSYPRDAFESLLDAYEEALAAAAGCYSGSHRIRRRKLGVYPLDACSSITHLSTGDRSTMGPIMWGLWGCLFCRLSLVSLLAPLPAQCSTGR